MSTFETLDSPDVAELSMLFLQDIQYDLWDRPLEEQQAALEEEDYDRIAGNIVDCRFKIASQVAYAPDPDVYFERGYIRYTDLRLAGYAASVAFRNPIDKYGGLMVDFVEPAVEGVPGDQAEFMERSGLIVPVLAIVTCDKVGHVRNP